MGTHFYSNYPGTDLACEAAKLVLSRVAPKKLPEAVLLLPTRRAVTSMREAFTDLAKGKTLLLPRMISLADVGDELLTLLGHDALAILKNIPPAMSKSQRNYLLTAQVMRFEAARGGDARVEHAMRLAEYLADLQDRCTRAHIELSADRLKELFPRDYATHWQQSLAFLNIVGEQWPAIEQAFGQITEAAHEVQLLAALRNAWEKNAPDYPVFAIGSTASQLATAALLSTIAAMEQGVVILPGLDPRISAEAWDAVHESHPYFHLKNLLTMNGVGPSDVTPLGEKPTHCSIWLEALCRTEAMVEWRNKNIEAARFDPIRILACRHAEEEARVITLLMREGLEEEGRKVALITPDESLMARVAVQLRHYGITANRLAQGTLADTPSGSLLAAIMEAVAAPESTRALVQLLRHPLAVLGEADQWSGWLDLFERSARGIARHEIGQLPKLPEALRDTKACRAVQKLVRDIADLSRARLVALEWVVRLEALVDLLAPTTGAGAEKVSDALTQLSGADLLERLDRSGFNGLLAQALQPSWRGPQFDAHPNLFMLTPVEARLQHFDRVILGNMTERLWPGIYGQSPWLNLVQQAELGLPGIDQHSTLIAHDVLMQGSGGELFLTYPNREAGSPVARSRYIERLLGLLEAQGLPPETLAAEQYRTLASQQYQAEFEPEDEVRPQTTHRPAQLKVSLLDKAMSDPFAIYAEAILGLRALDALDAEPEPRNLGTVVHGALKKLAEYWSEHQAAPDEATLKAFAEDALKDFSGRPAVTLFWGRRLMQALTYVNAREAERRGSVDAEKIIEQAVATRHGSITLKGKVDRREGEVVVDHKTGKPPSQSDIRHGEALQLLAYAMMLAAQGQPISSLEYWGMPSGKRPAKVESAPWGAEQAAQLQAMLDQLMDPATAFLARPVAGNERYENDYDGISRYDEWAG